MGAAALELAAPPRALARDVDAPERAPRPGVPTEELMAHVSIAVSVLGLAQAGDGGLAKLGYVLAFTAIFVLAITAAFLAIRWSRRGRT